MKKKINNIRRAILQGITKHLKSKPTEFDGGDDFLNKPLKILISRPNSRLGNLLMVTPLVQEIQRVLPNAKVDIFCRGGVGFPIFENYSNVNKLIVLPGKPFKELAKYLKVWNQLRKENYDLVLNVISNSSSGRLSVELSNAPLKDFGDEIETLKQKYPDYVHMAQKPVYNFRYLLEKWGYSVGEPSIPTLSFNLTEDELNKGKGLYQNIIQNQKPTIYIYTYATGSKCLTKDWWIPFYERLLKEFPTYNIVEVLPKEKVSQIDFKAPSYYSLDLHEMVATISKGDLFITADCGVMHLASAAQIPVLALFNITPIPIYKPYNKGSKAVYCDQVNQDDLLSLAHSILVKND